eukprot:m.15177 g.15177  ORF g.15177 m.15177 type:complete len:71 (-) comp4971_c0_seq1:45-257(-)
MPTSTTTDMTVKPPKKKKKKSGPGQTQHWEGSTNKTGARQPKGTSEQTLQLAPLPPASVGEENDTTAEKP